MQQSPKFNPNADLVAAYLANGGTVTPVRMTRGAKGITKGQLGFRSGNHVRRDAKLNRMLEKSLAQMPSISTEPEVKAPKVAVPVDLVAMTNTAIVALFNATFQPFGASLPGHVAKKAKKFIITQFEAQAAQINAAG